jgi:hypothetical protein
MATHLSRRNQPRRRRPESLEAGLGSGSLAPTAPKIRASRPRGRKAAGPVVIWELGEPMPEEAVQPVFNLARPDRMSRTPN